MSEYPFTGRNALLSNVSALDESQDKNTTGKKKPSPRRVAQEGFMAASVCRQEQTDVDVDLRFRRQQDRIDSTIHAMSSPSGILRRRGARLATRIEPASGQ
jgi:hypothetical protein